MDSDNEWNDEKGKWRYIKLFCQWHVYNIEIYVRFLRLSNGSSSRFKVTVNISTVLLKGLPHQGRKRKSIEKVVAKYL